MIADSYDFEVDNVRYKICNNELVLIGRNAAIGVPKKLVIPACIQGMPVKRIAMLALHWSQVEMLYLPDTLSVIEEHAFKECPFLTHVEFYRADVNDSMRSPSLILREGAFCHNRALKTFRNTVQVISRCEYYTFRLCTALTELDAAFLWLDFRPFMDTDNLKYIRIANGGKWKSDTFGCSGIKELRFDGTVTASDSALKAVRAKHWVCTNRFNRLNAAGSRTKISYQ